MPWKGEANPYFIWLSEIILQQTRTEQGLPYYQKFITKYPTVIALAVAADDDVFKLWEGLGYYSRCRNLLKTAGIIAKDYSGFFPADYDELLKLPGVGPYTAAAIASFAFGLPHAVLDGNVYRVISRYFGIFTPIDSTIGKKIFTTKVGELLDKKKPAFFNQAIMDFGATVCTPKQPGCDACILNDGCIAYNTDQIHLLPVKQHKIIKSTRYFYYGVVFYKDEILVRQRHPKDIWQNLFEFFLVESDEPKEDPATFVADELRKHISTILRLDEVSALFKQTLTHRRIQGNFASFRISKKQHVPGYDWVKIKDAKQYAFPIYIQQYAGKNLINLSME